eukprot:CAMPEP_0169284856 /NCGR_PEP_ID=MMETSP1016-20121227/58352_1 /TAXON_ID=342587 /ORGANISM="Karlodinium micrum, Strain CCMP2283" /LENGTH=167 /DNA_ID=CAMNT_0009374253 /DNA_START=599 /DNA_END=1102 /DNA_ORIENTATION=-
MSCFSKQLLQSRPRLLQRPRNSATLSADKASAPSATASQKSPPRFSPAWLLEATDADDVAGVVAFCSSAGASGRFAPQKPQNRSSSAKVTPHLHFESSGFGGCSGKLRRHTGHVLLSLLNHLTAHVRWKLFRQHGMVIPSCPLIMSSKQIGQGSASEPGSLSSNTHA